MDFNGYVYGETMKKTEYLRKMRKIHGPAMFSAFCLCAKRSLSAFRVFFSHMFVFAKINVNIYQKKKKEENAKYSRKQIVAVYYRILSKKIFCLFFFWPASWFDENKFSVVEAGLFLAAACAMAMFVVGCCDGYSCVTLSFSVFESQQCVRWRPVFHCRFGHPA